MQSNEELGEKIGELESKIEDLEREKNDLDSKLDDVTNQLSEAEEDLEKKKEECETWASILGESLTLLINRNNTRRKSSELSKELLLKSIDRMTYAPILPIEGILNQYVEKSLKDIETDDLLALLNYCQPIKNDAGEKVFLEDISDFISEEIVNDFEDLLNILATNALMIYLKKKIGIKLSEVPVDEHDFELKKQVLKKLVENMD